MGNSDELHRVCSIIDKLTLDSLQLLEEQIEMKLNIENTMTIGEAHLAKSRYILGQNQVSSLQLPGENATEFNPTVVVATETDPQTFSNSRYLETVKYDDQIDPVRWFGYLVPQQLSLAKQLYQQTLQWVVQSVNLQTKFVAIIETIGQLKDFKRRISTEE